ncbi:uncharacterized protein TRUGW13939_06716 [Talaromyces rugulosus]|uniref:Uncharacterized protein n=1 Tax=Talaromyces rugulosus TaxID=121627 RepID=A0A7H8QZN0_TALRU|nr:uncharacterized protein TRUGW13939_06716 [Talaromyces rugulosus]QKX59579.1 hypothetical protein TRUGW13939_06716 [Talaromyces rugulosus]
MARVSRAERITEMVQSKPKTKTTSWNQTKKRMRRKVADANRKGVPTQFRDLRNPEEQEGQVVDLDSLDEPPASFYQQYYPWLMGNGKYPTMADGYRLLDFYFWGIDHHFPGNNPSRAKCFVKLFYNMDPKYRPTTKYEFEDVNRRDAGPRLLKRGVLERLGVAPISRHYPEIPEPGDAWEQQLLAPVKPSLAEEREIPKSDQEVEVQAPRDIPKNLNQIRQTLEKLLIQIRYRDLEVPEDIGKHQPQAATVMLSSTSDHEFTPSDQGTSYLCWGRGPVADEQDGWRETACDCIMMAAKFLDAGITTIDINEIKSDKTLETSTHDILTNAVRTNWGSPGDSTNIAAQRENFHRNFLQNGPQNSQDLIEFSTLLRKQFLLTREKAEFCEDKHKNVIDQPTYHRYMSLPKRPDAVDIGDLLQDAFGPVPSEDPPLVESIQRFTQDSSVQQNTNELLPRCSVQGCRKHVRTRRVCYTMPLRLAIYPTQDVVPKNHTSDNIQFTITNNKGKNQTVNYRWLGGIYSDSRADHRVYWTDAVRGGKKASSIRMYDPFLRGYCIGGIKPAWNGSLIPQKWQPSVIFYEAILNPDSLDLALATAVLGDIGHAVRTDKPILQVHKPWSSSTKNGDPRQGPEGQVSKGGHLDTEFVTPALVTNGYTTNAANMPNSGGFNTIPDVVFENPQDNLENLMGPPRPIDTNLRSAKAPSGGQYSFSGASNANGIGHNAMYSSSGVTGAPISNGAGQPSNGQFQVQSAGMNRTQPSNQATPYQYVQPNNYDYAVPQLSDEGLLTAVNQLLENPTEYDPTLDDFNIYNYNFWQGYGMPDVSSNSEHETGKSSPRKRRGGTEDRRGNKRRRRG